MMPRVVEREHVFGKPCWCDPEQRGYPCRAHKSVEDDERCNDCLIVVRHRFGGELL
jgi:hypothetical protein